MFCISAIQPINKQCMSSKYLFIAFFAVLFSFVLLPIGASKSFKYDDKEEVDPSSFLVAETYFPDHPFQKFISGELANVLIVVHNQWKYPVTVFGISGAYYTPDYAHLFRNITQQKTYFNIGPDEHKTFQFKLKPEMEASRLALVLNVDFTDASEVKWYRAVAVNRTVEIVAPMDSLFDMESIIIYLIFIALLVWLVYVLRKTFVPATPSKRLSSSIKAFHRLSSALEEKDSALRLSKSPGSKTSLKSSGDEKTPWTDVSEWIPDEHFRSKSPKQRKDQ